jgi:hypothetical protein
MAAPAELRTPNMHRAKRIAPRECAWKHGDSGQWVKKKKLREQHETRIPLTPTGLLMEGDSTPNPRERKMSEIGIFRQSKPLLTMHPQG